jgi:undecaprenyl-diphosphatase
MEYLLGIIQGITELLPISSTGHLLLFSELADYSIDLELLTLLHIGSLIAIVANYWSELITLLNRKLIKALPNFIIITIPGVIFGLLIGDILEESFYGLQVIAFSLLLWGAVMIYAEIAEKNSNEDDNHTDLDDKNTDGQLLKVVEKLSPFQALVIGLGQSLALIPGTSRSGITTLSGMLVGIKKNLALDLSFIVGIPLIAGAFLYEVVSEPGDFDSYISVDFFWVLGLTTLVSILSLKVLRKYSRDSFFTAFGVYRIVLALMILTIL